MLTTEWDLPEQQVKILIVDDEASSVLELSETLASLGTIQTASSGKEALRMIDESWPDLVLLDIEMPEMDGFEVCKAIRSRQQTKQIGIVFVTAHSQQENQIASLNLGSIDFISKPIDYEVCKLRIRNLLQLQKQSKQLCYAKQELEQLVYQVPNFISYWDKDWQNRYSNDANGEWFGFSAQELKQHHISLILPKHVLEDMDKCLPNSAGTYQLVTSIKLMPEQIRHFIIKWSVVSYSGHDDGYLLTIMDISHQKQIEQNLHSQKVYLDIILDSVAEGIIATDVRGLVSFINPKAELITGWSADEVLGKSIEDVMQLRDPDTKVNTENPIRVSLRQQRTTTMPLNTQLVSRDGRLHQIEQTAAPLRDESGRVTGAVAVVHDISHSISLSLLRNQASSFDPLTNVPNRLFIREKLQLACEAAKVSNITMAMAVIDIDYFKAFNDSHGNGIGDAVLKVLARRLFENYEPDHSVGRLGADEFMVILRGFKESKDVDEALYSLLDLLRTPVSVENETYSLSVSIGVSMISADINEPDKIMQQADAALYRAKFEGGDRYKVFSKDLEVSLLQRRSTEELLRSSLNNREKLVVVYQPKVALATDKVIGVEALARLRDDAGKLVSPIEFIPIAEETGLILQLGSMVLQTACEQCKAWLEQGISVPVSVNISALQCQSDDLVSTIKDVLYATGLPAAMLEIEVTETAFIRDFEQTLEKFKQIKEMGVAIAIDDFGKGYSNLTYLRRLDVDKLKLDMSYVRGMLDNARDYEIVKTIVNLGRSMHLTLIAEGIETDRHRDALLKLGCEFGQGYLYAKPLSNDDFIGYLEHNHFDEKVM
jgi:diguanylate cyclase (GGDEF)-like protein/PAS domain S-box-containing protein